MRFKESGDNHSLIKMSQKLIAKICAMFTYKKDKYDTKSTL
ncbi:Uncharacterised protein [Helicobacter muridarum]|uniref:Uncharacterized protein n=1 Tax=Helicobacter muridarum TaxID=216 RepID=A0A377PWP9_9HELI|nr:Uncharacterised protein [Helicobacter muridarum]